MWLDSLTPFQTMALGFFMAALGWLGLRNIWRGKVNASGRLELLAGLLILGGIVAVLTGLVRFLGF